MTDTADRVREACAASPYLTVKQTAFYLGISERTLRAWLADGRGPRARRHGRHWRYHIDDVEAWSVAGSRGGGHD